MTRPHRLLLMNPQGECVWGIDVSPERDHRIKDLLYKDDGIAKMKIEEEKPKTTSLYDLGFF